MSRFYRERVLAPLMDRALRAPAVLEQRAALLRDVEGEVLEVGFGSGAALPAYDPAKVRRVVGLDPEEAMLRRFRPGDAAVPVSRVQGDARRLPFRDGAFQAVVSNLTLCSIEPLPDALREIRRVLAPGGRFFFLEHGLGGTRRARVLQALWNPIHRRLAGGCRVNLPMDRMIREAGFEILHLERYRGRPGPSFMMQMYRGVARRAAGAGREVEAT